MNEPGATPTSLELTLNYNDGEMGERVLDDIAAFNRQVEFVEQAPETSRQWLKLAT